MNVVRPKTGNDQSSTLLTKEQSAVLAEARVLTSKSDLRAALKVVLRLFLLFEEDWGAAQRSNVERSAEWVDLMRTPLGNYIADSAEFDDVRAEVVAEIEAAKG